MEGGRREAGIRIGIVLRNDWDNGRWPGRLSPGASKALENVKAGHTIGFLVGYQV